MFEDVAEFKNLHTGSGLKITKILHKAVIDVNENGTVAAAATRELLIVY